MAPVTEFVGEEYLDLVKGMSSTSISSILDLCGYNFYTKGGKWGYSIRLGSETFKVFGFLTLQDAEEYALAELFESKCV